MSEIEKEELVLRRIPDYSPVPITVNNKNAFLMMDNHGTILPKKSFQSFLKSAVIAYEEEGIEDYIKLHNFKTLYPLFNTEKAGEKHRLPKSEVRAKDFRQDIQRNWSFKCSWCERKVSSKTDERYFLLDDYLDTFQHHKVYGRFCQETCAEQYWHEQVLEFLKQYRVSEFYHLEKRERKEAE